MEPGSTILLKLVVYLIEFTVIGFCIFGLPWRANISSEINQDID